MTESPIRYIMRHTQLNPRQFLHILNAIWVENRRLGNQPTAVSAQAIEEGIRRVEEGIIHEIHRSYEFVHPEAAEAAKAVISELPRVFSHGDLERAFRREGASAIQRVWTRIRSAGGETAKGSYEPEYLDFKSMLAEVGCIGKVTSIELPYVRASFEYSAPSRLQIGSAELMCVHPLFSGVFASQNGAGNIRAIGDKPYVVMPSGAEIDLELD